MALRRDVDPEARFRTEGIEDRCTLALADLTDHDALVRVLNEHEVERRLPPGGADDRGHGQPLAARHLGGQRARHLHAARGVPRRSGRCERVVVASSDKAYGDHDELPYREDFALQPRYPYDVSKACTDLIARSYAHTYDLPVAVTRLANIYGPGDLNWSRIVPDTARALARGERPVIRSDGTPERDYLYVEDAVDAYLAIAASLDRPELRGRAWNAGWGRPVPVIEVVRTLIAVSGRDVEPDVRGQGTPHGEIDRQYLDSTAIREQLGWEPRWDLERGLAATWEWYERTLRG